MWNSSLLAVIELTRDSLQPQPGEPVNPIDPVPTAWLSFDSWGSLLFVIAVVLLAAFAYAWLRPRTKPPMARTTPRDHRPPNHRPNERLGS